MKILSTTDYDQFKRLKGNRLIYKPHLNGLVLAIQENNLLQYKPIEVNDAMEIADGQHRLEAAKILKVPIYYTINPDADINTATLENIHLREWKMSDHLHKYVELGYQEYIDLQEFAKEYGMPVAKALLIANDNYLQPEHQRKQFKTGKFSFVDREKAHRMASFVNELKKYCEGQIWVDRDFLRSVDIMLKADIDQKLFIHKLEIRNVPLTKRFGLRDNVRQLEDVLNYKQREGSMTHLY